jgi:hypothetical protein
MSGKKTCTRNNLLTNQRMSLNRTSKFLSLLTRLLLIALTIMLLFTTTHRSTAPPPLPSPLRAHVSAVAADVSSLLQHTADVSAISRKSLRSLINKSGKSLNPTSAATSYFPWKLPWIVKFYMSCNRNQLHKYFHGKARNNVPRSLVCTREKKMFQSVFNIKKYVSNYLLQIAGDQADRRVLRFLDVSKKRKRRKWYV